jgi:hypothetical protein
MSPMRRLLPLAFLVGVTACQATPPPPEPVVVGIPTVGPRIGEQGCRLRLNSGTLVADADTGLAVHAGDERIIVVWPLGWSALDQDGMRILLDDLGDPIARVGDLIAFGGAEGPGGRVRACGDIKRLP